MTKDKKRGSRKKTGNSPSPRPPTKRGDIEGQPDTQPKANDCRYVKQDPPDVYVNIPPPEKKEWNLANKIALGVGIVTTALTVFTYLLFVKAGVQAEQAVRTANSADSVFAVTQHEWQIENEPYLQIMQPKIESFIGYNTPHFRDQKARLLS